MTEQKRNIAILGSTGSVGRSALEVVQALPDRFNVVGLTGHSNLELLAEQAKQQLPQWIVATDSKISRDFSWPSFPENVEIWNGENQIERLVSQPEVDVVLAAIVGSAGLNGTWAALEHGKTVALANKETLVMAGPLVMDLCQKKGGQILPVDSEHSAVFQALQSGDRTEVRRVVLTASGGPFRAYTSAQLKEVTIEAALAHPTWSMGPKITVDSATMMNKALEVIEARWLFDLAPDQIEVVVHPQSVVHSLVEFQDSSVIAQLSPPDMKLPIQYALSYPQRCPGPSPRLDLATAFSLEFEPPDLDRFPALQLGFEVAREGGTAGAVLNAANEAAVAAFLDGQIRFTEIVPACRSVLNQHTFEASPALEQLIQLDQWARQEVTRWVCA